MYGQLEKEEDDDEVDVNESIDNLMSGFVLLSYVSVGQVAPYELCMQVHNIYLNCHRS